MAVISWLHGNPVTGDYHALAGRRKTGDFRTFLPQSHASGGGSGAGFRGQYLRRLRRQAQQLSRPAGCWTSASSRRQSGPLEPAPGLLPGSATTPTGRYTTPRPSEKLHPQAVDGADGRYGGSPEGQTVMRAVPPICSQATVCLPPLAPHRTGHSPRSCNQTTVIGSPDSRRNARELVTGAGSIESPDAAIASGRTTRAGPGWRIARLAVWAAELTAATSGAWGVNADRTTSPGRQPQTVEASILSRVCADKYIYCPVNYRWEQT